MERNEKNWQNLILRGHIVYAILSKNEKVSKNVIKELQKRGYGIGRDATKESPNLYKKLIRIFPNRPNDKIGSYFTTNMDFDDVNWQDKTEAEEAFKRFLKLAKRSKPSYKRSDYKIITGTTFLKNPNILPDLTKFPQWHK